MAKTVMIRARIEPGLKREAEVVFGELGLSVSEAFNLFCRQVVMHRGLPFAVEIPNEETLAAIQRVHARKGLIKYDSWEDFRKEMNSA